MKHFTIMLLLMCLTGFSLSAQKIIKGVVTESDGTPLIGVSIAEKGTTNGTTSDINGAYELKVSEGATLEFTYTGFGAKTVAIGDVGSYDVTLEQGVELDEIVITALGISREKKGLTYSVDEVDAVELTAVKDVNAINALSGKTSGLVINRNGGGVGGSTRITLRGNSSLTNNEPLIVVDGIPLTNNRLGGQANIFGGGIDTGDGIGNINPEDIESMSVLKGASASALYGSQAANGVLLIVTKKGAEGKTKVNVSSSLVTETAAYKPEFQFDYGQTSEGAEFSWGDKVSADDHISDFFKTGINWINAISLSGGRKGMNTYFSYSNTRASGILPGNKLTRHNLNFNQSANFFDDRLEVSSTINFINQDVDNRAAGGLYFNPLSGLYFFPRGLDFNEYETNFETFSSERNISLQNWVADRDIQQNPFWILNRNANENIRNRAIGAVTAKININDDLSLRLRGNIDKAIDRFEHKIHAGTQATLSDPNGRYILRNVDDTQNYGDLILSYNKYLNDNLSLDVNVGGSNTINKFYVEAFDSQGADLRFANKFSLQNIMQPNSGALQAINRVKTQAVFASAQVGLNNTWYLDLTGRNDWTSSLPGDSFFYPSIGVSAVLSELIDSKQLDFAKVRLSYAQVGNGVASYVTNSPTDNNSISSVTGLQVNTVGPLPGTTLEPEKTNSFEAGLDLRMLSNRMRLDFTYYNTNTINQFLRINAPLGSGFSQYLLNAGDIQNSGIEALLSYKILEGTGLAWDASLNLTKNNNKILELHPELDNGIFYINPAGVNSYAMVVSEGGSFGDIYGRTFLRDDAGSIVVDADGRPQPTEGALEYLGNPNPKFMLGFNNEIKIKDFTIRLLIDGRFGGEIMSVTEALLDEFGVSKRTGDARDAGSVEIDGVMEDGTAVTSVDPEAYYTAIGGRSGITEAYMYDATNIRLRELSIGFGLPKSLTDQVGFLDNARLSIVGRNLFFFKNNAPFDPDVTFATGVGFQGVDVLSLPSTRSFGFNLSVGF